MTENNKTHRVELDLATVSPPVHTCSVLVEKSAPEELREGIEFEYEIRLTNLSPLTVESVVVVESLLSLISIVECTPSSQVHEEHTARWSLGPLYPNAAARIRVRCQAKKDMRFRSHTAVHYAHGS